MIRTDQKICSWSQMCCQEWHSLWPCNRGGQYTSSALQSMFSEKHYLQQKGMVGNQIQEAEWQCKTILVSLLTTNTGNTGYTCRERKQKSIVSCLLWFAELLHLRLWKKFLLIFRILHQYIVKPKQLPMCSQSFINAESLDFSVRGCRDH